ncbi:MAG: 50S ribosomal protein L18 [Myxococcota bacterium]|nr:50S ribosomal protein L18 [Myxococcota bacterium]
MKPKIHNTKLSKQMARKSRVARRLALSRRPRLTVFRSAKHIYAQLDDPQSGRTLAMVSTRNKGVAEGLSNTGNVDAAKKVGTRVAEIAREKQIEEVVFNRNGFLYHGRVKALAEAAREAGLKF